MKYQLLFLFVISILSTSQARSQNISTLDTIKDTATDPYRLICYQHIHRKRLLGNSDYHSTGFLIARNVLLTAAHNLFSPTGSKVDRITICPGRFKDKTSYDTIIVSGLTQCKTAVRVNPNFKWKKASCDFAIIIIPEEILNKVKNWPNASSFELDPNIILDKGDRINVAGFPASGGYDGSLMTYQNQDLEDVKEATFHHSFQTETGNSGSPIWVKKDGRLKIVGIHTYAGLATRLTPAAIEMINLWIAQSH